MRIARLAARQAGRVSTAQLRAAGLTKKAIAVRVARGSLHPALPGVLVVGHVAPMPLGDEWAAVLACGAGTLLGDGSSAYVWGFDTAPARVEVIVPVTRRHRRAGISVRRSAVPRGEARRCRGLPVTSPERTLLDLAASRPMARLERLVAEAIARGVVRERALVAFAEAAAGRRGAPALRAVVASDGASGFTRSEAERLLRRLLREAGLLPAEWNVVVGRSVVDARWPAHRLIVEVDGYRFHHGRPAFESDRRRDLGLEAAGWQVLRVTWRQLTEQPTFVVAAIAAAIARREGPHVAAAAAGPPVAT